MDNQDTVPAPASEARHDMAPSDESNLEGIWSGRNGRDLDYSPNVFERDLQSLKEVLAGDRCGIDETAGFEGANPQITTVQQQTQTQQAGIYANFQTYSQLDTCENWWQTPQQGPVASASFVEPGSCQPTWYPSQVNLPHDTLQRHSQDISPNAYEYQNDYASIMPEFPMPAFGGANTSNPSQVNLPHDTLQHHSQYTSPNAYEYQNIVSHPASMTSNLHMLAIEGANTSNPSQVNSPHDTLQHHSQDTSPNAYEYQNVVSHYASMTSNPPRLATGGAHDFLDFPLAYHQGTGRAWQSAPTGAASSTLYASTWDTSTWDAHTYDTSIWGLISSLDPVEGPYTTDTGLYPAGIAQACPVQARGDPGPTMLSSRWATQETQVPQVGAQNGAVSSTQELSRKPSGSPKPRGRRKGALAPETSHGAQKARSSHRVCIPCKRDRAKCFDSTVGNSTTRNPTVGNCCNRCAKKAARSKVRLCVPAAFAHHAQSADLDVTARSGIYHMGSGSPGRTRFDLPPRIDRDQLGRLCTETSQLRVNYTDDASGSATAESVYVMDLHECQKHLAKQPKDALLDEYGRGKAKLPPYSDYVWQRDKVPLSTDVRLELCERLLPAQRLFTYTVLQRDGGERQLDPGEPSDQPRLIIAAQLCFLINRSIRVAAYKELEAKVIEATKKAKPAADPSLLRTVRHLACSLRFQAWLGVWVLERTGSTSTEDNSFLMSKTLAAWALELAMVDGAAGGSETSRPMRYPGTRQTISDDYPREYSTQGLQAWLERGRAHVEASQPDWTLLPLVPS